MIGYVAKLDQRCSPSEMIGEPVASQPLDRVLDRRVLLGLELVLADLAGVVVRVGLLEPGGRGSEPTGSVGIPVSVRGS